MTADPDRSPLDPPELPGPTGPERRTDPERYLTRARIGRGATGVVEEVFDRRLGRVVARKTARFDSSDGELFERFVAEAQITAQLAHPGITPVHELGIDAAGRPYFTVSRVDGVDLTRIFERVWRGDPGWTITRCVRVFLSICETVAEAHARGVVHRDLKPANVCVGAFGEAYVLDWGLARVLPGAELGSVGPSAELGVLLGTPGYMAPEQAAGRAAEATARADVYAIGAMLYELLAGFPPYSGPGRESGVRRRAGELLESMRSGNPAPLERVASHAPTDLVAISQRAMRPRPEDRYDSALDLADDLRRYLEGRVVRAHRTGALAELAAWVRRHRASARAGLGALLLVSVGLGVAAIVQARHRAEIEPYVRAGRASLVMDTARRLHPASSANREALEALQGQMAEVADPLGLDRAHVRFLELWSRGQPLAGVDPPTLFEAPEETLSVALFLLYAAQLGHLSEGKIVRARGHVIQAWRDLERERSAAHSAGPGSSGLSPRVLTDAREVSEYQALALYLNTVDRIVSKPWVEDGMVDVEQRVEFAREVREATVTDARAAAAWRAAADRVRRHPAYGGLELVPQEGLLPLGPDGTSGLEEFWVPGSGDALGPDFRDPTRERVLDGECEPDTLVGIRLVLLPGGTLPARWVTPGAEGELSVEPFFVGKLEVTHDQWSAVLHRETGYYGVGWQAEGIAAVDGRYPAHHMPQAEAARFARRLGLALPTDAQWAWAASAGATESAWNDRSARPAPGRANLEGVGGADRYLIIAPVDAFPPNAFGLHGTIGNVAEWCAATGVEDKPGQLRFWARGGSSATERSQAVATLRTEHFRGDPRRMVGLRVARALDTSRTTRAEETP